MLFALSIEALGAKLPRALRGALRPHPEWVFFALSIEALGAKLPSAEGSSRRASTVLFLAVHLPEATLELLIVSVAESAEKRGAIRAGVWRRFFLSGASVELRKCPGKVATFGLRAIATRSR